MKFEDIVWDYYRKNKRDMPWRKKITPYRILVSEIMLQQTQVNRVVLKFESFIKKFPNFEALAKASLAEVLSEWKGLGYNRRGIALHTIAKQLIKEKKRLPKTVADLVQLPHIGPNTAGSIAAFAYNSPTVFIETNIRTVFIHHFFKGKKDISDKDIIPLIEKTIPKDRAREWYWALMDYGTHLKKTLGNLNIQSKHYTKQSTFKDSNRELRSKILDAVRLHNPQEKTLLKLDSDKQKILKNIETLIKEGFIVKTNNTFKIA